ncbi:ARE2 [Sanghuangporus sanghuang]
MTTVSTEDSREPKMNGTTVQVKPSESIPREGNGSTLQRTRSGGFPTSDGTLYVSKPFRTTANKKSRAVISFVPRNSTFDPQDTRGPNEFRGFFSLFWISMFILVVQNYVVTMEKNGYPIELAFARMFSRDAFALALSDGILALSTGFAVPFSIVLKKGWLSYGPWGLVIQYLYQTFVLVTAVTWTYYRRWPWVQSGFFTLHSMVMIMKMHSYMSTNGYLQRLHRKFEHTMNELRSAASQVGGWDVAITEAAAARSDKDSRATSTTPEDVGVSPSITPMLDGTQRSYIDGDVAVALRKKLLSVPRERVNSENGRKADDVKSTLSDPKKDYSILVSHPNEEVAKLAEELVDMDSELTSQGPNKVRWPDNINWRSFADYMLIPTLVYELEYPRTDRIRPLYVFEKTTATFGTFALLYTITENFILPIIPMLRDRSFLRNLLDLALPFMVAYLLLFYIIFECICNGFAELTRFADRQFYEDWVLRYRQCRCFIFIDDYNRWNSTSWDEFARKWNKPVHMFLLRHVYASSISGLKLRKTSAMFITFFISACLHELVMVVVTKKIRMYLFALQLIQIPLIAVGRTPAIKRNKKLGNVVFWVGLYAGFPLLCVAYCVY